MPNPTNLFWDSCVFIRYLTKTPTTFVQDIADFIEDARKGDRTIFYSTLVYAEISPDHLKMGGYGSIHDLIADFQGAFEPIDPTPNIFADAALMRSPVPTHPTKTAKLTLGTPDAIHLATCLHVRDALGMPDVMFHTFDATPGNGWNGKTVPIIGMEQWYASHQHIPVIAEVCKLQRTQPLHPQPKLPVGGLDASGRQSPTTPIH